MSWWLLGIVAYYIIGIIVGVYEWVKDTDLTLINIPIILLAALVWPIIVIGTYGTNITLIKKRRHR